MSRDMAQRTIVNPIFKDSCTFLQTSAETNGKFSEMEFTLGPGGGNPVHRHTGFTETFTAIDGNLGLSLNGREIVLKLGETVTVKRGEVHRFYNKSKQEVKFNVVITPGHAGAENMLRIMYGLAQDGMTDKKGVPKSLKTIAVVGELGDSSLAGFLSILTPILKVIAAYARREGHDKMLLEKYC
jgi:quercetin dioxygenase-like cupin family protein